MPQSDRIEQLKAQFTDQYVMVNASRPELARFQGMVGQVKTINCNGRALVQFEGSGNRGWYDLQPEDLQVVDKPEPPAAKPPCCKPKAPPAAGPNGTS